MVAQRKAILRDVVAELADQAGIHAVYTDLAMDPTTCVCRLCWMQRTEWRIRAVIADEIRFGPEEV